MEFKDKIALYLSVIFTWLIVLSMFVLVLMLSGCIENERETGLMSKEGRVTKIEYDVIFGACFTDWRNEIYFDDGDVLWTDADDDLDCIKYNLTGVFYFEKNYFTYDDARYKLHDFQYVEYLE